MLSEAGTARMWIFLTDVHFFWLLSTLSYPFSLFAFFIFTLIAVLHAHPPHLLSRAGCCHPGLHISGACKLLQYSLHRWPPVSSRAKCPISIPKCVHSTELMKVQKDGNYHQLRFMLIMPSSPLFAQASLSNCVRCHRAGSYLAYQFFLDVHT